MGAVMAAVRKARVKVPRSGSLPSTNGVTTMPAVVPVSMVPSGTSGAMLPEPKGNIPGLELKVTNQV
jgi:hypothetical protein